jgi:outer membrane biosynthesis protein TonB
VQKSTSTILIAFLAGLVVAGGSVYVVSTLRSKPAAPPPAVQTAAVQPVTQTASPAPVPPPEAALAHEPAALAEPPAAARPKPRPAVAKRETPRHPSRLDDEASAAPQPTHAEVAQNTPPPAPVAAQSPEQAAQPAPALTPPPGTQTAPPPPREPKTVAIPAGTTLTVRVNETLSTETNYSGDTFTASLDKPLVVDGFVIADRGARVSGKITQAQKAGRVKGISELALALTQIHTTDGQTVAIETTPWTKQGPQSKKGDAAKIGGGAALGAIIGAIAGGGRGAAIGAGAGGAAGTGAVLTMRGKAAVIPSETRITFSLENSVPITERLN